MWPYQPQKLGSVESHELRIRGCYHCNSTSDLFSPLCVSVGGVRGWVQKHEWVCTEGTQNTLRSQKVVGPLCNQKDGYQGYLFDADYEMIYIACLCYAARDIAQGGAVRAAGLPGGLLDSQPEANFLEENVTVSSKSDKSKHH